MNERIDYYDSARGILIFLVVLGHLLIFANPTYSALPYSLAQSFIYSFHMPAFFLLSGMLFCNDRWREKGWRLFLRKRAETLLIPYVFFEVFAVLYKHFILHAITISEGLRNMVCCRCNVGADWFLPAIFLAQVFFFFCVKYIHRTVTAILAVVSLFCTWFLPSGDLWNVLCRGLLGFAFLYLGNVLKGYLSADSGEKRKRIGAGIAAFCVTVLGAGIGFRFATNDFYMCVVENPPLFVLTGLSGLYGILTISRVISFRWLRWFGENSIIIMGTHQLVLYTVPATSSPLWVVGMFALIVGIEVGVILFCNRFCPHLVGKGAKQVL